MGATLANDGVNPLTGVARDWLPARHQHAQRDEHVRHVRQLRRVGVQRRAAREERRRRRSARRAARPPRNRRVLAAARQPGQQRSRHRRVRAAVERFEAAPAGLHVRRPIGGAAHHSWRRDLLESGSQHGGGGSARRPAARGRPLRVAGRPRVRDRGKGAPRHRLEPRRGRVRGARLPVRDQRRRTGAGRAQRAGRDARRLRAHDHRGLDPHRRRHRREVGAERAEVRRPRRRPRMVRRPAPPRARSRVAPSHGDAARRVRPVGRSRLGRALGHQVGRARAHLRDRNGRVPRGRSRRFDVLPARRPREHPAPARPRVRRPQSPARDVRPGSGVRRDGSARRRAPLGGCRVQRAVHRGRVVVVGVDHARPAVPRSDGGRSTRIWRGCSRVDCAWRTREYARSRTDPEPVEITSV